jgi:deoxyribose-phosphate aldolase
MDQKGKPVMLLTARDIAKMIDLSCVRTSSNRADIEEMVRVARQYGFGQVSVLQCFIPLTRQLLQGAPEIHVVGNVSFPSGSDSTSIKVAQAGEMLAAGVDEIDMVMNIGELRSGMDAEVAADVRAVRSAIQPVPLKVIIEIMSLNEAETRRACQICLDSGASFVKTGTGWAGRGTTLEDVRLVKACVGERIQIKASGGIRSLDMLAEMYRAGARRFGINLNSSIKIVEECLALGAGLEI